MPYDTEQFRKVYFANKEKYNREAKWPYVECSTRRAPFETRRF